MAMECIKFQHSSKYVDMTLNFPWFLWSHKKKKKKNIPHLTNKKKLLIIKRFYDYHSE